MVHFYITDENPKEAASHLDDATLTRMTHSGVQMLCTALYNRNLWSVLLYAPAYEYDLCVQWAGESRNNFIWAYKYVSAVISEYRLRGLGKAEHHLVQLSLVWDFFKTGMQAFPSVALTEFPNDTPYKTYLHPDEAYRKYLLNDVWNDKSRWTINGVHKKKPWFYRLPIKEPVRGTSSEAYPRNMFA